MNDVDMPTIAIAVYAVISAVTFVAFALDKRAAAHGRRRTSEAMLHALELAGGFPGAFLAMLVVRHKNRKLAYLVVTLSIALLHVAAWWAWLRA